ncbi:MAG: ABC transporter permease [Spirochaetales bacterium]|jgi:spermidine/putrescine transport system permease protein|nr:ABC transporter permease [Spirochaetales bacterium]
MRLPSLFQGKGGRAAGSGVQTAAAGRGARAGGSVSRGNLLQYPYILWAGLFIFVPLVIVLWYSFTVPFAGAAGSSAGTGEAGLVFSAENYRRFLSPVYVQVLYRSIVLAIKATFVCLLIGYPAAMIINAMPRGWRNTVLLLMVIPMWINFLLRTYAWMVLLGRRGVLNTVLEFFGLPGQEWLYTETAVLIGMVYNFLPFMVLPLYSALSRIGRETIEAAEDLGANGFVVFRRVILPQSVPGVIAGITMVFMPAVSTFVISALLGGGQSMLIGNLVEQQFLSAGDWHFGSALSIIMMAVILFSMAIVSLYDKGASLEGGNLW